MPPQLALSAYAIPCPEQHRCSGFCFAASGATRGIPRTFIPEVHSGIFYAFVGTGEIRPTILNGG